MSENTNNHESKAPTMRPVEIDDLYRFLLLSDPQISPDGERVAYVQTRLRKKKNDYASNIWLVPSDGGAEAIKFTQSEARDMSPRWSPDGLQIAFISTRSGKPQIWLISLSGGEAHRLTRAPHGVGEFEWSPDGEWIAYTSKLDSERDKIAKEGTEANDTSDSDDKGDKDGGSSTEQHATSSEEGLGGTLLPAGEWEEDEDEKAPDEKADSVRVVDRLHYIADGEGFLDRWTHIFLIPARGGKTKQLTRGEWNAATPRWSPDGKRLAYLANREPDADYRAIQDIFVLDIEADGKHGEAKRVTKHNLSIRGMDWLASGEGFAALAHSRLDEAAFGTNAHVWNIGLDGESQDLTSEFDRNAALDTGTDLRSGTWPMRLRSSKDASTIYFMATDGGSAHVYSVSVSGGKVSQVTRGERIVLNFTVQADRVAFVASTATSPNELYAVNADGTNERTLTGVNKAALAALDVREPETFWIEGEGGVKIQGWLIYPPGYSASNKYPLVLEIHGGPHTSYGEGYFHEFQALAAKGYIVLYTNPRGSQGYGQDFSDAITNDWGGIDYRDIMACVDHAISLGSVDESRLGVCGGSYGGYMSAWIVGHTDRFKAAVASRLVSNLYSAWGSGDFTWMLWSWELQGTPQERTELYIERSPVTYADKINTPLLLTHAEDDHRCDLEQAQQMYMALKVRKKEVKMVLFPSGGHDVSRTGKPGLRVERIKHIADWFDKYLGK